MCKHIQWDLREALHQTRSVTTFLPLEKMVKLARNMQVTRKCDAGVL